MSNLDTQYIGSSSKDLMEENPDVVRQIERYFERRDSTAIVRIYVFPRSPIDSKLEWTAVVTSRTGRYTVMIKQRLPGSSITFAHISHEQDQTQNPVRSARRQRQGTQSHAAQWFPTPST